MRRILFEGRSRDDAGRAVATPNAAASATHATSTTTTRLCEACATPWRCEERGRADRIPSGSRAASQRLARAESRRWYRRSSCRRHPRRPLGLAPMRVERCGVCNSVSMARVPLLVRRLCLRYTALPAPPNFTKSAIIPRSATDGFPHANRARRYPDRRMRFGRHSTTPVHAPSTNARVEQRERCAVCYRCREAASGFATRFLLPRGRARHAVDDFRGVGDIPVRQLPERRIGTIKEEHRR